LPRATIERTLQLRLIEGTASRPLIAIEGINYAKRRNMAREKHCSEKWTIVGG